MRHSVLTACLYLTVFSLCAQSSEGIIKELQFINRAVVQKACGTDSAAAISNRAMNVFLADKTGYLSTATDLSFYTNYVTINTAEGKFTVNHNFQKTGGTDEPIKKLFSIGFDMTIAGSYAKSFLDKRFENALGVSFNYTLLGKVKTFFANCAADQKNSSQKQAMDALRAALLQSLETEIQKKEADFKQQLAAINSSDIPGQRNSTAKALIEQHFRQEVKAAYEQKWAIEQAALLTSTANFSLITTHWTNISAYVPLLFPTFTVAPSLSTSFSNKHPYPFNIMLSHTRLWESSKAGRIFFTLNGTLLFNNSKLIYGLNKLNYTEYKSSGGLDTVHATDPGNNALYIGLYKTFVSPSLTARVVYFPPGSHVGISVLAEQNFGWYHLLNVKLGIPVVLINSKKTPAVNIECYVLFFDPGNRASTVNRQGKTSLGLSVGIPFSRLMY